MTDASTIVPTANDAKAVPQRGLRFLTLTFVAATALGSALLFLVEPLVVRLMLPLLGGSPAVWNTSLVFFQSALLVGYLLAHVGRKRLPWSSRPWIQIGFVALGLLVLPVAIPDGWAPPSDGQAFWILAALTVVLGLPFVALSMLSPTLQGWFADTSHPRRDEPYFLYAAGNVGSVVGLLGYPLVVEPFIGLQLQSKLWAGGYLVLIGLLVSSAYLRRRHPSLMVHDPRVTATSTRTTSTPTTTWRTRGAWVLMAAVPSGLLLAVTQHVSADVASVPLLWVVPLTVYLGTFVIAFAKPTQGCPPALGRISLLAVLPLVLTLPIALWSSAWLIAGLVINIGAFGLLALAVHYELSARRPPAERLTEYYLWIAVGGLVGGIGVALASPLIFDSITEYPLFLIAALAVLWFAPFAKGSSRRRLPVFLGIATVAMVLLFLLGVVGPWSLLVAAIAAGSLITYMVSRSQPRVFIATMAGILALLMLMSLRPSLHQDRSFFGVLRVTEDEGRHDLVHGSTIHGSQQFEPSASTEPTFYYRRDGGVGRLMDVLTLEGPQRHIAVVGLGAGTLASYGRDIDTITFYEIDQSVLEIAENPELFTFLSSAESDVSTNIVDGRLGLATSSDQYDLIVLDAFSSDAIPVHLLTKEAVEVYAKKLTPSGVVAIHITNRYFDLKPIVARVGTEVGFDVHAYETTESLWVVLSNPDGVESAIANELTAWDHTPASTTTPLWTDDYANLLSALTGF